MLITIFLTLLYGLGFPPTLLCLLVCSRHALQEPAPDAASFWRTAEGYAASAEDCSQQS
jgi:hypothetical protein